MPSPFNVSPGPSAGVPLRTRLMLVNGRTFTVAHGDGTITAPTEGTVFEDLRVLSRFNVSVTANGTTIGREELATATPTPFHADVVSRPRPTATPEAASELYVHRQWVGRGVRHDIELLNTGRTAIERTVSIELDTDFAHVFDMKAGRGASKSSVLESDGEQLWLRNPDDDVERVRICTEPAALPSSAGHKVLCWHLRCPAHSSVRLAVTFEPVWDGEPAGLLYPLGVTPATAQPASQLRTWRQVAPRVDTNDARLAQALDVTTADLASLRIFDPLHPARPVVAAGAPWFMTLFGRDSLLTSWMALPFVPELAVGVLTTLAELQGTATRPETEEQPGRIIHELRRHGGGPFADRGRYFGSVDATPLFVMLAAETSRWGHLDDDALASLWPHIRAAIGWVAAELEQAADGFLRYQRSTDVGLINQGWKDSWDGVTFADGRIPSGPIALSEVQGYAYAALLGAAELAERVDQPGVDVDALTARAEALREGFNSSFWDERSSSYALGVTDGGALIDSVTTNPGHAIWTGLTVDDCANRYLDRILDDDLWSGWGLRTLSPSCAAYDPLSYHNGSVWPHDTALVAAGAARLGRLDVVERLVDAALDACEHFGGRPPELFAGVARDVVDVPVSYPNSCSPQAWSSASIMLHLRSVLDLRPPEHPGGAPRLGSASASLALHSLTGVRAGSRRFRIDQTAGGWQVAEDPPASEVSAQ